MKKIKIEIPIFQKELTIILDEDLSYIENKYKTIPLGNFGAVTMADENKYGHYIVAFTDKTHLSNIAHEIVHIKNHIYLDCAMEVDRQNDETEAYLTGWLFDQIYNAINK